MKLTTRILFVFALVISFIISPTVFAEDKNTPGGIIPKLPKTQNDPVLSDGHVYPFWGPPCQRYTYSVIYRDKEGRKPEYMKIYFNGKMIGMDKENQNDDDYKKGVKYIYKYVPNKVGSNFYYFEASNGLGKTRASIIDSPDNGPVLFTSAFDKNEIAVIDKQSGQKILEFSTGKEWVGGIALSADGKYLAAKTSYHVYFFDLFDKLKVNPERGRRVDTAKPTSLFGNLSMGRVRRSETMSRAVLPYPETEVKFLPQLATAPFCLIKNQTGPSGNPQRKANHTMWPYQKMATLQPRPQLAVNQISIPTC